MKTIELDKPHAIIAIGAPGSGKSTFASAFARAFNMPHIDRDYLRQLTKNRKGADEIFYGMISELSKLKRANSMLVIDGCDESPADRTEVGQYLASQGYKVFYVWVQTDSAIAFERLAKKYRGNTPKTDIEQTIEKALNNYKPITIKKDVIVISGRHTFATQAKTVLKRVLEVSSAPTQLYTPSNHDSERQSRISIQ